MATQKRMTEFYCKKFLKQEAKPLRIVSKVSLFRLFLKRDYQKISQR